MGTNIVNSSFNISEAQASSLNCSPYYYTNDVIKSGVQVGSTFIDVNAYFTSDLIGGLIQFSNASDNNSGIQSALILDVISQTELLLDVEQNVSFVDYTIWFGGVQLSQRGSLALNNLIIDGVPFGSLFTPRILTSTTPAEFVPSAGVKNIYIQAIGGGGAGGGYLNGINSVGGGGGAGGYVQYYGPADAFTYQCGLPGAGFAGANGGDGTATLIGGSAIIGDLTANGANGGFIATSASAQALAVGGVGGLASGGTFNFAGMRGGDGVISTAGLIGLGGAGAPSQLGIPGSQVATISTAVTPPTGVAAVGYGAGGSGAIAFNTISSGAGGAGGDGIIFVYEI